MQDRFYLRYVYNNKIYDVFAVDFFNKTAQLVSLDRAETLFAKVDTDKLIQCTGLRDKNDKLIFEGDIVKSSTTYWNGEVYSDNGLICWDRTKWQIGVMKYERPKSRQNKRYDRALDFARFVSFQDNTPLKKFANVEVIGNVYENPELIKEKI